MYTKKGRESNPGGHQSPLAASSPGGREGEKVGSQERHGYEDEKVAKEEQGSHQCVKVRKISCGEVEALPS